jgi:Uma2 family endonuclease
MRAPDRREKLTVDALYRMPDDGFRHELQAGLLLSEPRPGFQHGRLVMNLGAMIHEHVKEHRLGVVVTGDPGFVLARNPDTLRGPDVAFVSQRRADEQRHNVRAFEGAPDLAVEVLSPSDVPAEVRTKVAEYLAAGWCGWSIPQRERSRPTRRSSRRAFWTRAISSTALTSSQGSASASPRSSSPDRKARAPHRPAGQEPVQEAARAHVEPGPPDGVLGRIQATTPDSPAG